MTATRATTNRTFTAEKAGGKLNMFFFEGLRSIPEFLRDSVLDLLIEESEEPDAMVATLLGAIFASREVKTGEAIPFGSFVSFEADETCTGGYNCWCKANATAQLSSGAIREENGEFFSVGSPVKAELFDGNMPSLLSDVPLAEGQVKIEGDKIFLETPWGTQEGTAGNVVVLLYGVTDDGIADLALLTRGTASWSQYQAILPDGTRVSMEEYVIGQRKNS